MAFFDWRLPMGKALRHAPIRGRGAVARWLHRHAGADLVYRDHLGYRRTGDLRAALEAYWFVGLGGLPRGLLSSVPAGSWAIDVGANTGLLTEQLCRAVGKGGLVWAIEPLPLNLERLHELVARNDIPQLTVFECALGSRPGVGALRTAGPAHGAWASFTASWLDAEPVRVEIRRLDDLVGEASPPQALSLMKIDVEGAEFDVLDGARRTLAWHRPLVHCEFNDPVLRDAGRSSTELLGHFGDIGYEVAASWHTAARSLDGRVVDLLLTPRPVR